MISLEEILDNCYPPEDQEKSLTLLKKFEFIYHINSCIKTIKFKLRNETKEISEFGVVQLASVTSILLSGINEKLRSIPKESLPLELEQILADISKGLLEYVLLKTKSDKRLLIEQISVSLHDTCVIHGYDEEKQFLAFLGSVN